jgi:hypothetical protein
VLVDHPDPGSNGIRWRVEYIRLSIDDDFAFIRFIQAIKLAHQGAFSRAVLAQERHNLTRIDIQADPVIRQDAWETLNDVAHFDVLNPALFYLRLIA